MVVRDGKVAMSHWSSNPAVVKIDGTDIVYYFAPQHNVSLAWVAEEHVEKLLSIKQKTCDCAGGSYGAKFRVASEINVCIFETGDRCRPTE